MFFKTYIFQHGKMIILFCISLFMLGRYLEMSKLRYFAIILLLFSVYFFRIPRFQTDVNKRTVVAPCYGKVNSVERVEINGVYYYKIVMLISVFDIHIQYAPVSGKINDMIYKKGEFYPVYFTKKSNFNERMMYYVNNGYGNIIFSQIAGMIARTIVPFKTPQDEITQGEEIGLIKFGSRSDIFIQERESLVLNCKKGDRVYGGQTVLAYYH